MFDDTEGMSGGVVVMSRFTLGKTGDAEIKIRTRRVGTPNADLNGQAELVADMSRYIVGQTYCGCDVG